MSQDDDVSRCQAGRRCTDGETVHDPDTGGRLERLGAVIETGPLCEGCIRAAVKALRELPLDVVELSMRLTRSTEIGYEDPDMPTQAKVKKAAPLPFDEYVYTLMELIDYETALWAEAVADHDQVDWDSSLAESSRRGRRVSDSCALLGYRLTTLINLPVQQHRAHSLTDNPAHGHDPDTTTRYRGDYWSNMPGWEAALRFIDLHRRATRHIGKKPVDDIKVPCPTCHQKRLRREHHNNRIICRACDHAMSDDDYDALVAHLLTIHGSLGDVITRKQAAELAGVKPGTIRKWVQLGYIKPLPTGGYRRVVIQEFLDNRARHAEEQTAPNEHEGVPSESEESCPDAF